MVTVSSEAVKLTTIFLVLWTEIFAILSSRADKYRWKWLLIDMFINNRARILRKVVSPLNECPSYFTLSLWNSFQSHASAFFKTLWVQGSRNCFTKSNPPEMHVLFANCMIHILFHWNPIAKYMACSIIWVIRHCKNGISAGKAAAAAYLACL